MTRLILLLSLLATFLLPAEDVSTPLGLPTTITDLYVPGEKIEPIPRKNRDASLVIRVLEIKPASDGFRYDLEVYGLDPGTHKLADYLHYVGTNAPLTDLDQTIEITVRQDLSTIPEPTDPKHVDPDRIGGYRLLTYILGILWLLIFLFIIFYKKKKPREAAPPPPPPTLHEKLHALVTSAAQGDLPDQDRAQLERLVLGHWKEQLPEIAALSPSKALTQLRTHPEASPLLLKLEEWLHSPNPSTNQSDLLPLLKPYQNQTPQPKPPNQALQTSN